MEKHVLVTGAAGRIGSYFTRNHGQSGYRLRLMVRGNEPGIDAIREFGEVVACDLSDLDGLKRVTEGIDTVVHLAGNPSANAVWEDLLETNIVGTYNICAAAKSSGCRRIVFASSIHAVSGYPVDVQVKVNEPVNPGDVYGVSKCFGEAMCRYLAEQEGVSAIAVRIGAFQSPDTAGSERGLSMLDAFVSERDLTQLLVCCIDAENVRFAIVHGLSGNRFNRLDISDARERFGYAPVDDSTQLAPALKDLNLPETLQTHSLKDNPDGSGLREDV
jgi:nucleoside-diphosphate-sugar epimerase